MTISVKCFLPLTFELSNRKEKLKFSSQRRVSNKKNKPLSFSALFEKNPRSNKPARKSERNSMITEISFGTALSLRFDSFL